MSGRRSESDDDPADDLDELLASESNNKRKRSRQRSKDYYDRKKAVSRRSVSEVITAVDRAPDLSQKTRAKRKKLFVAAYNRQPYTIDLGEPCEFCGAPLLALERVSVSGTKLSTPCCGNGKVRAH